MGRCTRECSRRNEVDDALAKNGIGARKYFYPLTNTFECFHNKYDVDETILHRGAAVAAQFAADYLAETAQQ